MGSYIEINDTLQLTREQGFPDELDFSVHEKKPFTAKDFEGRVFEFHGKPDIRIFHIPPVRVFLVQNVDNKWIYWGFAHITEVKLDYIDKTTSGKFKIIELFSPEDIKKAHHFIDGREEKDYFAK